VEPVEVVRLAIVGILGARMLPRIAVAAGASLH